MFVFGFVVCCYELISRSDESYYVCVCVCVYQTVCDLETSTMRRPRPEMECCAKENEKTVK
jgi:hypothetical protein